MAIKMLTCLKIPRPTIMAIIKKCKTTIVVMNLPEDTNVLCSHTVKIIREAKMSPKIILVHQDGCAKSPNSLLAWRWCLIVHLEAWCNHLPQIYS